MRFILAAVLLCAPVYAQLEAHGCFTLTGDGGVGKPVPCSQPVPFPGDKEWKSIWVEQGKPSTRWHWSVLALASATAMDVHSSQGLYEMNPVLGRGPFGGRQAAVKVSIVGGLIAAEYLVIRKWPKTEKAWRWVNWLGAAGTVGVAASNYTRR